MDEFIDIMQDVSIENSWPFYLILYSVGLIVTIVAIQKNKKKKAMKAKDENEEMDELLK